MKGKGKVWIKKEQERTRKSLVVKEMDRVRLRKTGKG